MVVNTRLCPKTHGQQRRRYLSMNAILMMPPKFSWRSSRTAKKTRRHSFSQPINRSTTLRPPIGFAEVEFHRVGCFGSRFPSDGTTGADAQLDHGLLDPVGSITLIASEGLRPGDRISLDVGVRLHRRLEGEAAMRCFHGPDRLSSWNSKRVPVAVAEEMDLRGKSPAGTALMRDQLVPQGPLFSAPAAQRAGADDCAVSMHHNS